MRKVSGVGVFRRTMKLATAGGALALLASGWREATAEVGIYAQPARQLSFAGRIVRAATPRSEAAACFSVVFYIAWVRSKGCSDASPLFRKMMLRTSANL